MVVSVLVTHILPRTPGQLKTPHLAVRDWCEVVLSGDVSR